MVTKVAGFSSPCSQYDINLNANPKQKKYKNLKIEIDLQNSESQRSVF